MKQGKSLMELAAEIQRQSESRVDYIADTRKLEMLIPAPQAAPVDGSSPFNALMSQPVKAAPILRMRNGKDTDIQIGALAHRQIGERLGVPAKFYDRLLSDHPDMLAETVTKLFNREPEKRMIRTLDGSARAFLSNAYARIDNNHVAEAVLPILAGTPGIEVVSCEVTERRLYLKAVTHSVRAEVKSKRVGDVVEAGVIIQNSEVGLGAVSVMPFFHFLVCTNGMVRNKEGLRSAHIGTKLDGDEHLAAILADDTRKTMDRAVILKVRDVVTAAMNAERFQEAIARMNDTTKQFVTGDPGKAIEVLADDFQLADAERSNVLRHLIEGGDLSRYGVINAITRSAEDAGSYDRATELETLGGRLLDMSAANWGRIAEAA